MEIMLPEAKRALARSPRFLLSNDATILLNLAFHLGVPVQETMHAELQRSTESEAIVDDYTRIVRYLLAYIQS